MQYNNIHNKISPSYTSNSHQEKAKRVQTATYWRGSNPTRRPTTQRTVTTCREERASRLRVYLLYMAKAVSVNPFAGISPAAVDKTVTTVIYSARHIRYAQQYGIVVAL